MNSYGKSRVHQNIGIVRRIIQVEDYHIPDEETMLKLRDFTVRYINEK